MRTQEIPDDDLDDLFRKASEEHVEEFDPEAWRRMEKLLDNEGGRGGAWPWWRGLWALLGLLLLGTLGIWYINWPVSDNGNKITGKEPVRANHAPLAQSKEDISEKEKTGNPASPAETAKSRQPAGEGQLNDNQPNTLPQHTVRENSRGNTQEREIRGAKPTVTQSGDRTVTLHQENPDPVSARNRQSKSPENKQNRQFSTEPTITAPVPGNLAMAPQKNRGLRQHVDNKKKQVSQQNHPDGKPTDELDSEQVKKTKLSQPLTTEAVVANQPQLLNTGPVQENRKTKQGLLNRKQELQPAEMTEMGSSSTLLANEIVFDLMEGKSIAVVPPHLKAGEVPEPEAKPYFIERPPAPKPYRISAAIMVSPDLSSVGFFNAAMPGTNIGARLDYRISGRISVNVGLIHSVKIYSAKPEDYSPPYGTWSYGKKPSAIDAKCKILDIPVNLRIDVVRKPNYTLFISNGLSSYVMLSEKYDYTYAVPNPHLIQSWSGRRTGSYKFSVYNISLGYERQFSQRLSWQVEPFLKLPLGGVGFGKVKLLSTGIFLTARYQFLR